MKIAISGCGRIGRTLFRLAARHPDFEVIAVNDLNPDPKNLAYLLAYDSEYGRLEEPISAEGDKLHFQGRKIPVFCEGEIEKVPWGDLGVELLFDATGVHRNVLAAPKVIQQGVNKVLITHSPSEVDRTLVLGANEDDYQSASDHIISSSICDAVAISPVLRLLHDTLGVQSGFLTTLHPWLAYQNLLDGPAYSWATPGRLHDDYALGRASPRALIPKPTSAVQAALRVIPELEGALQCMSFRIPTPVVGAANLYLQLNRDTEIGEVREMFSNAEAKQDWPTLRVMNDPLISVDYLGMENSAIVDDRWTSLAGKRHLYIVLWYDNEVGYASHALRLAKYVMAPAVRRRAPGEQEAANENHIAPGSPSPKKRIA